MSLFFAYVCANAALLGMPPAFLGGHELKPSTVVATTKPKHVAAQSSSMPYFATIAPGDSLNGKTNRTSDYAGEVRLHPGDVVRTGNGMRGPTILHTGDGHVFTLFPHTKLTARAKDVSDKPRPTDVKTNYLFLSTGGIIGSSGHHSGSASASSASRELPAALCQRPMPGDSVPITVGTNGGTTGVKGSTFMVRVHGDETMVDVFDCEYADVVNKDGHHYHHDGRRVQRFRLHPKGEIKHW